MKKLYFSLFNLLFIFLSLMQKGFLATIPAISRQYWKLTTFWMKQAQSSLNSPPRQMVIRERRFI